MPSLMTEDGRILRAVVVHGPVHQFADPSVEVYLYALVVPVVPVGIAAQKGEHPCVKNPAEKLIDAKFSMPPVNNRAQKPVFLKCL